MHIICASYHNIGPFEGQTISICLHQGTYLIKAPIGSGKSFLFFDGLVFALYGYSKRDMLNVNAESGWTKILFSDDNGDLFLIIRPLNGKKGVQLFKKIKSSGIVNENGKLDCLSHLTEVVTYDKDFSDYLDMNEFEIIDFHRASEIQQHIDLLLPPRSVFLHRHILMQDSENIFELQPKSRIDVLKLMFGLDMIDAVKDKIGDIKNELRGQFKVLGDSSHVNQQYAIRYGDFKRCIEEIKIRNTSFENGYDLANPLNDISDLHGVYELVNEYKNQFYQLGFVEFLQDPLSDNVDNLDYDISQWDCAERIQIIELCTKKKSHYISECHSLKEQLSRHQEDLVKMEHRLQELSTSLLGIKDNQNIIQLSKDTLAELQASKLRCDKEMAIVNKLISSDYVQLFAFHGIVLTSKTVTGFLDATSQLINLGKIKKSELESLQSKYELFKNKIQSKGQQLYSIKQQLDLVKQKQREQYLIALDNTIRSYEQTISGLEKQKSSLIVQIESLSAALTSTLNQIESKEKYYCSKIDANCPFVDQITQGSTKNLHTQVEHNQKQLAVLQNSLKLLEDEIIFAQKQLLSSQSQKGSAHQDIFEYSGSEYVNLLDQIALLEIGDLTNGEKLEQSGLLQGVDLMEKTLEIIRSDYKVLSGVLNAEQVEGYHKNEGLLKKIDQDLIALQQSINQEHGKISMYISWQAEYDQLLKSKIKGDEQILAITNVISAISHILAQPIFSNIDSLVLLSKQCVILVAKAKDLYIEKLRITSQTKLIKQELDQANILHTVFSKELTLYVLQSSLPILNEYINAFLAKVVDFQLTIQVNSDGDELELIILDSLGSREVKSLSGGQRTILRLCWILATSVVFRNSFLLLDETINNMDTGVVSKVAELLTDFVRQYNLTLYIVTHSEQIQHMSIRDKIIELNNNNVK